MPNRLRHRIKTSLVTFGSVMCGMLSCHGQVAKEMLDRQLKVIEDTAPNEPVVLRLDEEMEELVVRAKKLPDGKQVDFLAAGLSPQGRLYATFGMSDLNGFAKLLLGKARYPHVDLGRDAFAGRDLSGEIRKAYAACAKAYGEALPKAPLYKVAFGYQRTTNAQTQGIDRKLGRHIVVFNRSALVAGQLWDAAIIHESWHCFLKPMPAKRTLLDWAVHEGVVTHLTQIVDPTLADHTIMLWSEDEWAAAEKHRDAIIKSFATDRETTERPMMTAYMILGKHHKDFAAAPSRCGYYVGLLAARAWAKANPDKGARDLIEADSEEIWQGLVGEGG